MLPPSRRLRYPSLSGELNATTNSNPGRRLRLSSPLIHHILTEVDDRRDHWGRSPAARLRRHRVALGVDDRETKWVRSKARDVDGYKLWYSGSDRRRNGVGILVDEELRGQVVEIKRVNDRLMTIKLVIGGCTLNVCSFYAPQVGLDEEEKKRFWEALDEVVQGVPRSEKIVVAGDFNGHIGMVPGGYGDMHEGYSFTERNDYGVVLLDFVRVFGLIVVNSSFSKKEDHLDTFRSAIAKTQIDFLLLRKGARVLCKDCKVIPSENLSSHHRLLIEEKVAEMEVWECRSGVDGIWDRAARCIRETARKMLGVSRGRDAHIKRRWQSYFQILLNDEGDRDIVLGELEHSERCCDFRYCRRFKVEKVSEAICRMRRGRATGLDEIPVDFWKFVGRAGLR
ncbi:craniofacial development protein 2-like [Capsicum annuum]|uniref:craniofacial development protein 2-like n=1 Tax=Capsicum annuum TaxID=4072 RepID=UPI001FB0E25D|nr:craniofacial development protein 2-like [Capsicum annuum]